MHKNPKQEKQDVTNWGGCQSFHQETSHARLSLNYRYKPPARHLESGNDPGYEYKWYNLTPRVLSLSLGN